MSKNIKKLSKVIIITGIAFIVNYFINFFLTRYITKNMGTEAYGYITLAKTFATYAAIITIALNSYASRFISVAYHQEDYEKANVYFNTVFFADLILGVIILILAVIFSIVIKNILVIPEDFVSDVKFLFILVFINLFITTSGTAFQAASYIKNKLDIVNIFRGLSYILEGMILICLYTLFTPKMYYVGIGLCMATILFSLSNVYITKKYTPKLRLNIILYSNQIVKYLVFNGIWNSLNSLGNVLNTGLDLLVSNLMLTPLATGQISIAKSIVSIFNGLYIMVSTPFQPLFLKSYAQKDMNTLQKQLVSSMKISGLISNLAFSGFISLGLIYYKLWIPEQDIVLVYQLTSISILSGVLEGAVYPLFYIYIMTVKNKVPCLITIAGGILNVLGMYILITYTTLGIYSVVLTTAVIMLIIEGVTNPLYMSYCLQIRPWIIYKPLLLHILSLLLMLLVFILLASLIVPVTWIELIATAILFMVLGMIIHFSVVFGPRKLFNYCKNFIKTKLNIHNDFY